MFGQIDNIKADKKNNNSRDRRKRTGYLWPSFVSQVIRCPYSYGRLHSRLQIWLLFKKSKLKALEYFCKIANECELQQRQKIKKRTEHGTQLHKQTTRI